MLTSATSLLARNVFRAGGDAGGCSSGPAPGGLGDDHALHELASRMERQARHQGALTALAVALVYSGVAASSPAL